MRRGLRPTSWTVSVGAGQQRRGDEERRGRRDVARHVHLGQRAGVGPPSTLTDAGRARDARAGGARASARCGRASAPARRRSSARSRRARRAGSPTSPARSRPAARSRSPCSSRPSIVSGRWPSVVSTLGAHARAAARRCAPSAGARATRRRRARSGPPGRRGCPSTSRTSVPALPQSIGAVRRAQPAQADAVDASVSTSSSSTSTPSARTARERRLGVARAAPAADERLALGERADQQRAVRDRLVARDGDVAVDVRGRLDLHAAPPRGRRVASRSRPPAWPWCRGRDGRSPLGGHTAPFWNSSRAKSLHLCQFCNFRHRVRPTVRPALGLLAHRAPPRRRRRSPALEQLGGARAPRPRR